MTDICVGISVLIQPLLPPAAPANGFIVETIRDSVPGSGVQKPNQGGECGSPACGTHAGKEHDLLAGREFQVKCKTFTRIDVMDNVAISGSLVAIVTPMHENGELDLERFRALIDFHVAEG